MAISAAAAVVVVVVFILIIFSINRIIVCALLRVALPCATFPHYLPYT
jgi:hypothetical protein